MSTYKFLLLTLKIGLINLIIILANFNSSVGYILSEPEGTEIIIKAEDTTVYDSIQISFWQDYIQSAYALSITKQQVFGSKNPGRFYLPEINKSGYIGIVTYKGTQVEGFPLLLINSGDQIQIICKKSGFQFLGKGSLKMKVVCELDSLKKELEVKYYDKDATNISDQRYAKGTFLKAAYSFFQKPLDSLLDVKTRSLERYQEELQPADFDQLMANLITEDYHERLIKFTKSRAFEQTADSIKLPLFEQLYNTYLKGMYRPNFPDSLLVRCPMFILTFLQKQKLILDYKDGNSYNQGAVASAQKFNPRLRDKILTTYILAKGINKVEDKVFNDVLKTIQIPEYITLLSSLRTNTVAGGPAFNFELEDSDGKIVRLQDFKGKIVFLDFWFTGCMWCKIYYKTLSEVEQHFRNSKDIVFISVCVDKSKNSWIKSIQTDEYTNPHAVNLYTGGKGLNHELLSHYLIKAFPTQIIIDQKMNNYNINNGIQKLSIEEHIRYLQDIIVGKKANVQGQVL